MGVLLSCCRGSSVESELLSPDIETKRRQQAEAAERRMREQESRGIKDPERLKEKQKRMEDLEKRQATVSQQDGAVLKWSVD